MKYSKQMLVDFSGRPFKSFLFRWITGARLLHFFYAEWARVGRPAKVTLFCNEITTVSSCEIKHEITSVLRGSSAFQKPSLLVS
jgi:hypothetical protein